MTSRIRFAIARTALAGGLLVAAPALLAPAAAQAFGPDVVGCVLDGAPDLGAFGTLRAALTAAKNDEIPEGRFVEAWVRDQRIAIDSAGVPHRVTGGLCTGSGKGMERPEP